MYTFAKSKQHVILVTAGNRFCTMKNEKTQHRERNPHFAHIKLL